MNVRALAALVLTMPGYSASTPLADVRAWLREPVASPSTEPVTTGTLMSTLTTTEAGTVLATLRAVAPTNPLVDEALMKLRTPAGLDLSHANARSMCDALFADVVLREKLKALGTRAAPRFPATQDKSDATLDAWITLVRSL